MKYTNKLKPTTRADSAQMLRMLNGTGVVQRTTTQRDIIRINFTEQGIGGISEHLDELEAIRSAGPEDLLLLYFSDCPGGVMGTGQSIINALMETPARTVAVLEGHNCSLATMIPLICREVVVTPYTSMMLHSVSGGGGGTMVNHERQAIFFSKMYSEFLDDVYDGFLFEEEIQDLKHGLEIYLDSDEIQERLQRRAELMEAESEIDGDCDCEGCVEHAEIVVNESPVGEEAPKPAKKAPAKRGKPVGENDDPDYEKPPAPQRAPKVVK